MNTDGSRRFLPGIFALSITVFVLGLAGCLLAGYAAHYRQLSDNRQEEYRGQIRLILPVADDFFTPLFTAIDSGLAVPMRQQELKERDAVAFSMIPLQQLAELGITAGVFEKNNGWKLATLAPAGAGQFAIQRAAESASGIYQSERWTYDLKKRLQSPQAQKADADFLRALGRGLLTHSDVPDQFFPLDTGKLQNDFVFVGNIHPSVSPDNPNGKQITFMVADPDKMQSLRAMIPVCGQPPVLICLVADATLPVVVWRNGVPGKVVDLVLRLQEKGWPADERTPSRHVLRDDQGGDRSEFDLFRTAIGGSRWHVIVGYNATKVLDVDAVGPWNAVTLLVFVLFMGLYAVVVYRMIARPLRAVGSCLHAVHNMAPNTAATFAAVGGFRESAWVGQYLRRIGATLHSLAKYVPEQVLERIVARGEEALPVLTHLDMTVLFVEAPVQEAMLNHPQALTIIDRYYAGVQTILKANEVTLDVLMPYGICACWENCPPGMAAADGESAQTGKAAAMAAVRTAGEIVAFVNRYNAELRERGLPLVPGNMGLYSGKDLCAGNLGTEGRLIFSIFGGGMLPLRQCVLMAEAYGLAIVCNLRVFEQVRERLAGRPVIRTDVDLREPQYFEIFLPAGDTPVDGNLIYCSDFISACECLKGGQYDEARRKFQMLLLARPEDKIAQNCLKICESNLSNDSTLDELTRALSK